MRRDSISADALSDLIERSNPVDAREWLDRALAGTLGDRDGCLTFDANLSSQRDVAVPVLQSRGLTAFWLVNTATLQGHPQPLEIDRLFAAICFNSADDFHAAFCETLHASDHWPLAQMLLEEKCFAAHDASQEFRFIRDEILGPARFREIMDQMIAAATFDATEAAKDLWMTESDVVALHRAGHVIGMHSHTGPLKFANLDEDAQRDEYFENYACLHHLLDERPIAMSHPHGSYNEMTLGILAELGIRVGFASDAIPRANSLDYPRVDPSAGRCTLRIAA